MDSTNKEMDNWDDRSDQVREILGKTPNWVIRSGTTAILVIILLVLLGAALVSYNDIIPAQIVVTSKNPPVSLKSMTSGKLTNVFVKPGQRVDKDEILAEIENNAVIDDIYYLKSKLFDTELPIVSLDSLKLLFPLRLKLGDVQLSFGEFIASYQNYIVFNSLISNKKQQRQLPLHIEDLQLSKKAHAPSNIGREVQGITYRQQLEKAYKQLDNDIIGWERKYILKSPINGKVTVFDVWNRNQNVSVGENIFTIVPSNPEEIIGRGTLPIQNSGKVKVGQKVIIKLDNYPFQEWGSLDGIISYISEVPKQGEQISYIIHFEIKNLTTSFDRQIDFRQEMQGTAEIVIEELSVLERIFYQLRKTLGK